MAHRLKGGGVGMSNDILNEFVLTRMFIDCLENSIVPSLSVCNPFPSRLFKSTIPRPHSPPKYPIPPNDLLIILLKQINIKGYLSILNWATKDPTIGVVATNSELILQQKIFRVFGNSGRSS